MPYSAIFTTLGLTRLADAQTAGVPLVFTHLAVGDGDGAEITPDASMTSLVNERARVSVNNVEIVPSAPTTVRVEGLIPADTGGFTIREAALFNGAGEMIAIASYPDIYKPELADGVAIEEYIRILLTYAAIEDIELSVDTSVIMATRLYVDQQDQELEEYVDEQDLEVRAYVDELRTSLRREFWFRDDFLNADGLTDTKKWTEDVTGTDSTITYVDDSAGGAFRAVSLTTGTAGTREATLKGPALYGIGTGDFYGACRVRKVSGGGSGVSFRFGLYDGATLGVVFRADEAIGTWKFGYGTGAIPGTDLEVATGSTYQLLEMERRSGVLYLKIDDVEVYSGAFTDNVDGCAFWLWHEENANVVWNVDHTSMWAGSSATDLAIPEPLHIESGYAPITVGSGDTHEYLDVVFADAFDESTGIDGYTVDVQISQSTDALPVGWGITNKTVTGFRIRFADSFDGECRWKAYVA